MFMKKQLVLVGALLLSCGLPSWNGYVANAASQPQQEQASQSMMTITGTVVDEKGEPIIGASVVEKGTFRGTATDIDGNFALKVKPGSIIKFSYLGCKTKEEKASSSMKVTLAENNEVLDEVVVVGYGTQKKVNVTGAVSTVDIAKQMEGRPVQDVGKALQGAVPGLSVLSTSGDINKSPSLTIRGVGTLSNGEASNPLIIVDGVPMDDISFLNTQDIESISVLKDAASSSIYGTRGAFGVILINTKSAKPVEKVTISYNSNYGWDHATYLPNYPSVPDQIIALGQANARTGSQNELFGMDLDLMLPYAQAWQQQHGGKKAGYREMQLFQSMDNVGDYFIDENGQGYFYADWDVQNIMFKKASPNMSQNLSVQGTSGKTNFYMSFGYNTKDGILNYGDNSLHKYNASVNVTTQLTNWLQVGARFNYSDKSYKEPNTRRYIYQYMWRWGSFFEPYGTIDGIDCRNTVAYLKQAGTSKDNSSFTRLNAFLKADVTKDITLNADYTIGIDNGNYSEPGLPVYCYNTWGSGFTPPSYVSSKSSTYILNSNTKQTSWAVNVYGNWHKIFNQDHTVNVMLGGNGEGNSYQYFWGQRMGLLDPNLPEENLATGDQTTSSSKSHWGSCGYFGRVNYDYKGIYLLELNGRYDGSSRFPKSDQWAFFPSGSIGYRFSMEKYWDKLRDIINNGKIRASYGEIGNEAVGDYMFISTISSISQSNVHWLNSSGVKVSEYGMPTLVSTSLSWERIRTIDLGLDLGFLNDKFTLSFDWFQRENRDMLAPGQVLPDVLGADAPYMNAGNLQTRGWEINLNWRQRFGDWNVYANFNIGDAKIKVKKWTNDSRLLNTYYSGATYGDIWGFETDRYFTTDDFNADGSLKSGIASQKGLEQGDFHYGPGDIKFKDLDGNGVIEGGKGTAGDHGDLKVIGNSTPRYEYSFRVGGSWRGFDIDCFFQGVGKRDMWTQSAFVMPMMRGADGVYDNMTSYCSYNYETGVYDINQSYKYPRMYPGNSGYGTVPGIARGDHNFYPQSKYLVNMSYLRFKNLTLGYTLPENLTRKAYMQKVRVYFSADNLCLLHRGNDYPIDPEVNASETDTDYANGTWGRVAPITRTLSFGLQVTF